MIQLIQQYYTDERNGSTYALVAAIIFLLISILLFAKFYTNPLSKGLAIGFLSIAILLFAASIGINSYNKKKLEETRQLSGTPDIQLQQNEITRMDKVMNVTFKNAFIAFAVLMAIALSIILFSKGYFWKGIGISFMLLIALAIISDSFSMQRNGAYLQTIKNLPIN